MSLPNKQSVDYSEQQTSIPSGDDRHLEEVQKHNAPQSRLKKVSKLEKIIFASLIVTFLLMAVATIRMTTAVNREEEAISTMQVAQKETQKEIDKLEQEKSELLKSERVKDIAEKAGIELREDNIRKIK
ncbi:cell division protein FtsL [Vagococcus jeotgali]|uniref:cell division protein FtsL n=1 Tax=Vagococcus jeotgali TaxID=3109030 RepID=UPI002DD7F9FF|nr:cell division protein FtsL [Vagococcus sp. B2T-5]